MNRWWRFGAIPARIPRWIGISQVTIANGWSSDMF
jgi:hypothetical protein